MVAVGTKFHYISCVEDTVANGGCRSYNTANSCIQKFHRQCKT